jgi:hypothetical protein
MKNADTTSIPEKKMRFSNAKVIDISRGERKKLRAIRRIKAPVTRKGAYLQLTYKVRNRGMKYRIHMVRPSGVMTSI